MAPEEGVGISNRELKLEKLRAKKKSKAERRSISNRELKPIRCSTSLKVSLRGHLK